MLEKKYLKWYNKIGYGSGDIEGNDVYAPLTAFMMICLTDDTIFVLNFLYRVIQTGIRIERAALGNDAGLVGAAMLCRTARDHQLIL